MLGHKCLLQIITTVSTIDLMTIYNIITIRLHYMNSIYTYKHLRLQLDHTMSFRASAGNFTCSIVCKFNFLSSARTFGSILLTGTYFQKGFYLNLASIAILPALKFHSYRLENCQIATQFFSC